MFAVTGKILEVDLTTKTTTVTTVPDEVYYNFLSGKGLGAWYLYNNIPAGADPLGADNILGFTSGMLTGTGALMCGRWTVVTKSPLTGGWGDANCGGSLSPAIKQCGYDAIFFKGASETPVYLYCDNKGAEIRDASAYWGMDATEAENKLIADCWTRKKPRVAVIGRSGELLSRISGICNDAGRIAARSGVGAVMGSKKLKAVVLAGSKPIKVADEEAVKALSKVLGKKLKKADLPSFIPGSVLSLGGKMLAKLNTGVPLDGILLALIFKRWGTPMNTTMGITWGDAPIKNWGGSVKDFPKSQYKKFNPDLICSREYKKYHCYSCGMGCGGVFDIKDLGNGEYEETHKPEYETLQAFGGLVLNDDVDGILYINELLNRAGMDSISAGNTIAFAIECFENGILTLEDTDGLELNWSNGAAIVELVKKMISREGIGDVLADGCKLASERIGKGSEKYAMHIGGSEPGMHDPRGDPELGIHFTTEPAPGKHTIGMGLAYSVSCLSDFCSFAPVYKLHNKASEYEISENEAMKAVALSAYSMVTDGVGGCLYGEMFGVHHWNPGKYANAAVGWDRTGDDYMECGLRIQTTRQLFNAKHGVDIPSVKLPARIAGLPPLTEGPLKGKSLKNEEMTSLYWKLIGWDEKTGIPTRETLEKLGLDKFLNVEEA